MDAVCGPFQTFWSLANILFAKSVCGNAFGEFKRRQEATRPREPGLFSGVGSMGCAPRRREQLCTVWGKWRRWQSCTLPGVKTSPAQELGFSALFSVGLTID